MAAGVQQTDDVVGAAFAGPSPLPSGFARLLGSWEERLGGNAWAMNHAEENGGDDGNMFEEELVKARSGKVTGIIIPPPDIRAVADKTAQWVAKNGKSFEERILNSGEGQSAKFNFMRPNDVYNAYYEHKIRQFEEGGGVEPPEKKAKVDKAPAETAPAKPKEAEDKAAGQQAPAATTTIGKATVLGPIARASLNKPSEPPPPLEFFLVHPEGLNALDVEIIKLTAQYTAASGRQFLSGLAQREQRNPQFDFLKPTHILFSYFTALVDAYTKILTPVAAQKERLVQGTDKNQVLERAVHRWEYEKEEEAKKKQAQTEQDAERIAYQALDWHDFVVVETINFAEDELLEVPGVSDGQDDMDVDMDMEEEEDHVPPPPPPPPRPPIVSMDTDETEIKVVSDYTPRVATGYQAPQTMFDPVSGREVPISEMDEHMRIQFLDPRWREEQKRALEKKKETALAEGADIAANVKSFAKKRTDIFGTAEDEERQLLEDQESRRRREAEANRIIWDGSAASAEAAKQRTMEAIGRGLGQSSSAPRGPTIGPSAPMPMARPPPPPPFQGARPPFQPGPPIGAGAGGMVPPPPPPRPPLQQQQPPPFQPPPQEQQPPMQQQPGMGGPPHPPPPPTAAPAPAPVAPPQPEAPRLLSEDEFTSANPGQVLVTIKIPEDDSNPAWGLRGQILSLVVAGVKASIKDVKELLTPQLGGMPPNKMQLKSPLHGFLKDTQTLASYNIAGNTQLELVTRSRGRR